LRVGPANGIIANMGRALPLTALLSQILVAFTIEFDNEAEHRLPHRTTLQGVSADRALHAPWLVSMVMWFNCMQHLGEGPISLRELERRARTETNLHGMQRWGYILVTSNASDPFDLRPQPRRASSLVQATAAGLGTRQIWAPLFAHIEERWSDRFGSTEIGALRNATRTIVKQLDPFLPDCLPILGHGLRNTLLKQPATRAAARKAEPETPAIDGLFLPSLLSKILLAFALEFESESPISLAICADVIRVLTQEGMRVRDLPALSGVSKEAIAMAFGLITVAKESSQSQWQVARLTDAGLAVQRSCALQLAAIEKRWAACFGETAIRALRRAAETIVGEPEDSNSLLMKSIKPYPGGWRAALAGPRTLPYFPMVLHRGGYPDGS
jgi:hypothetical protein